MKTLHRLVAIAALVVSPALTLAQATKTDRSVEPGAAEARQSTREVVLPKEWSHPKVEVRGVWLARNDMEGVSREELAKKLDAIREANLNHVLVDTWFQGYVPYPGSEMAPQYPKFKDQEGDVIEFLVREGQRRGLRVDLWPSYGFYAYFTPDATKDKSMGALLDKNPGLVAVDDQGNKFLHRSFGDYYSLCPSNPKSHELLAGLYAEQLRRYPADGLSLDRIRYPEENFCFCSYCKEHFEKETGVALKAYPAGSSEAKRVLEWRRERTVAAVAKIREEALKARPGIALTAYVVGPMEMDSKAQGWDLWVKRGLVDAVAVSMYGADIRPAAERALELLEGKREKLMCALNADLPNKDVYLANIEVARGYRTLGQVTWYLDPMLKTVGGLKAGPYAKEAETPLPAPERK